MTRIINGYNSLKVQIEANKTDVAVPGGVAISNGMYDKELSFDLPATSTTPMGMNKSGNQTFANKVWADVTGWVARSGFPNTVLTNNGLVVAENHTANISVNLNFQKNPSPFVTYSTAVRILVNGQIVKTATDNNPYVNTGHTLDVKAGDVIKVQAYTNWFRYDLFFFTVVTTYLSATLLGGTSTFVSFNKAKVGAVDFMDDLVFASDSKAVELASGAFAIPDGKKQTFPLARVTSSWTGSVSNNVWLKKQDGYLTEVDVDSTPTGNNSVTKYAAVSLGPVLAHSKVPYPVEPNMVLNFGGTLFVRRSGSIEKTEDDVTTGLKVRFSIWGHGKTTDEYGQHDLDLELMNYEAELQPVNNQSRTLMTFALPAFSDVLIPPNISEVYFSAAIKQSVNDEYASANFENNERAGNTAAYFGTSFTDPLYIKLQMPPSEQNTYKHPLSHTGVAMKNRRYFDNVALPKLLTFFGNNSPATVQVYASTDNMRGALLGTYTANAGERKTVVVESSTGQIELVSSDPYWVESCVAPKYDTESETQTQLFRTHWQNITEPLSGVTATRDESNIGQLQLSFLDTELAQNALLQPGKFVRLLVNHYGSSAVPAGGQQYNAVFTGMIRDYSVKYDYKNRPFIEVMVEDATRALTDTKGDYVYDLPVEYAPMLNGLGECVTIDGVDVSGTWKAKPDSGKNQPSAFQDGLKVGDSLEAVRNTNKGFVWVDRNNSVRYESAIDTDIKLAVTDNFASGDLSYSRIEKGTDTKEVINQVEPNEYRLDLDSLEDRIVSSELPAKVEPIPSMTQVSQWWYDQASIRSYGERKESFYVVRGTGKQADIKAKEFGPGFHDWADTIMDDYVLAKNRVSRVMIIPTNYYDLKRLSELEIFDAISIRYKNETHTCYVRKIEWTFVNNGVRVELYFTRDKLGVAWTPQVAPTSSDVYTDTYRATY